MDGNTKKRMRDMGKSKNIENTCNYNFIRRGKQGWRCAKRRFKWSREWPKMAKDIKPQIHKALQTPKRINAKIIISNYIPVQLLKTKEKENFLKTEGKNIPSKEQK